MRPVSQQIGAAFHQILFCWFICKVGLAVHYYATLIDAGDAGEPGTSADAI